MGPPQPHHHHHPRRLRPGTACTTCRRRKLRCSGTPNCERCAANHLKCVLDGDLFFKTYGPNTFLTKTTSPSTSGGGMTLTTAAALTLRLSFKQQHTPLHTSVRQVLRPHHPQLQLQQQEQQQRQEYGQQHPYRSRPQPTATLHGPQGRESSLDDESSSSKEFCPEDGPESQDENWSRGEDEDNDDEEEDEDEDYDKESTLTNRYHHHQHPEAIPPEPFAVPKPKKWTMRIENLLS